MYLVLQQSHFICYSTHNNNGGGYLNICFYATCASYMLLGAVYLLNTHHCFFLAAQNLKSNHATKNMTPDC
jgi:hypothetical protein